MDTPSSAPRIEALLEHSSWLRALARQLVGDAGVDDLVQETWLATLGRGTGEIRSERSWLAACAHNLARLGRRGGANRAHREREAARGEALPSTGQMAERMETQRLLAELVVGLDEPYRSAVWLRYYEGLAAAEIARRLGVPAGTVRWRVKEGLERLRGKLDGRFDGDRAAWCALLAPLAGLGARDAGTAASAAAWISGISTVKSLLSIGAISIALLLSWLALPHLRGEAASDLSGASPSGTLTTEATSSAPAESSTDREELVAEVSATAAVDSTVGAPSTPAFRGLRVRARVVDEEGRPIEGARMELLSGNSAGRAGDDGRIAVEVETLSQRGTGSAWFSAPGHAARDLRIALEPGGEVDLRDVVLAPGGAIEGTVVDGAGLPVAGASLEVLAAGEEVDPYDLFVLGRGARSDEAGRYWVEGVAVGSVRVHARAAGTLRSASAPIAVGDGAELTGVDIVLRPVPAEGVISGTVVDEAGEPVPFALVHLRRRGSTSFQTADLDGEFRFEVSGSSTGDLEAIPQQDRTRSARMAGVVAGTTGIVLSLREVPWLRLSVRDRSGEPVPTFSANLWTRFDLATGDRYGPRANLTFETSPGEARTPMPQRPFLLSIDSGAHRPVELGPFDPERLGQPVRVILDPFDVASGRVTGPDGPVAGARVSLRALVPQEWSYEKNGFPLLRRQVDTAGVLTDGEGRFAVPVDFERLGSTYGQAVTLVVRAEGDDLAAAESAPFDVRGVSRPFELRLQEGGAIEGRLVEAPERPADTRHVAASRGGEEIEVAAVDAEGRYRFDGLQAGRWIVRPYGEDQLGSVGVSGRARPRAEAIRWSCVVRSGETTRFDLDLTPVRTTVRGRLGLGGQSLAGWTAELVPPADVDPTNSARYRVHVLADDGTFEAVAHEAGPHRLILRSPGEPETLVFDLLHLDGFDAPWELDVERAPIRVPDLSASGRDPLWHAWTDGGERWVTTRLVPGDDGAPYAAAVPVGEGRLRRWNSAWRRPESARELRSVRVGVPVQGGR